MKKWLQKYYLPMWAKQTVLRENRELNRQNEKLQQEINRLDAYIAGLHKGLRSTRKAGGVQ